MARREIGTRASQPGPTRPRPRCRRAPARPARQPCGVRRSRGRDASSPPARACNGVRPQGLDVETGSRPGWNAGDRRARATPSSVDAGGSRARAHGLRRSRARHVGRGPTLVPRGDDAELRHERGERVVGVSRRAADNAATSDDWPPTGTDQPDRPSNQPNTSRGSPPVRRATQPGALRQRTRAPRRRGHRARPAATKRCRGRRDRRRPPAGSTRRCRRAPGVRARRGAALEPALALLAAAGEGVRAWSRAGCTPGSTEDRPPRPPFHRRTSSRGA